MSGRKYDTIEFYQDGADEWRWRIVAAGNSEIIAASSEGFSSKTKAVANLRLVRRALVSEHTLINLGDGVNLALGNLYLLRVGDDDETRPEELV